MSGIIIVDDVTRNFLGYAPAGAKLAGYDTGSGGIAWTSGDYAAHPDAIHIAQSYNLAADEATYPDVLDAESGAASFSDCGPWAQAAYAGFAAARRPGQRKPTVYASLSNMGAVTASLKSSGVSPGECGLWVADWTNSQAAGQAMTGTSINGYPVVGVQWRNAGNYDIDVFDATWWSTRAATPVAPSWPLKQGMSDGAGAKGGVIHTLQDNLNKWRVQMGSKFNQLASDGDYGPLTAAAVIIAQEYFHERGVPAGVCEQEIYKDLAAQVGIPAPSSLKVSTRATGADASFSWTEVPGYGEYLLQIEVYQPQFGWVAIFNKPVSGSSSMQSVAAGSKFRWRVAVDQSGRVWPDWSEFTTP